MTADAVGGVWCYALELARALAPIHFVIATMGPPPSADQRREAAAIANLTLEESSFRLEWMEDPWADVADAAEWLLALEQIHQPDLIHLNGYCHAALPWRAPCLVAAHSCVLSWWQAAKGGDAPASWDRYAAEVRSGIAAAAHVVAPTHDMLRCIRHHYEAPRQASVIPNGRHTKPRPQAKHARILSAGRIWDEGKNIATLVQAAKGLEWPVDLAGEAAEAGHFPNVRFLGRLPAEEMQRHLDAAAIYAAPALYEPFGLAILEAAQAGCALVLSDIPSLRELWDGAACFVSPRDPAAWHAALSHLIGNGTFRAHLARAARYRARRYRTGPMQRAYHDLYSELLAAPLAVTS